MPSDEPATGIVAETAVAAAVEAAHSEAVVEAAAEEAVTSAEEAESASIAAATIADAMFDRITALEARLMALEAPPEPKETEAETTEAEPEAEAEAEPVVIPRARRFKRL